MATVCWLIQQVSLFWVHQGVSNTRQADNDVTTRSCKTFPRIDSAVAVTYVSEPSERGCDSKSRAESVNVCLKILWCLLFSISNAAAAHCPHVQLLDFDKKTTLKSQTWALITSKTEKLNTLITLKSLWRCFLITFHVSYFTYTPVSGPAMTKKVIFRYFSW